MLDNTQPAGFSDSRRWRAPVAIDAIRHTTVTLILILTLAAPVRAQCIEGWLPGQGALGVGGYFVSPLAILPDGDVIVGGNFTTAGGVAVNNIARYNPITGVWSAMGSGVSGTDIPSVYALAVLPGGDVIVGGNFTTAGGVAASNIARVNPTTGVWSALGSGTNGGVSTLAVLQGGDVIVGGGFTTAGGVATNNIARYSPSTGVWSALGSGTNNPVNALAFLPGGDVIVGGAFTTAGGVAASRIARYNPTTGVWSALGAGTNASVSTLAVLQGGDVIVGGWFGTAGGVAASHIARVNPTTGVWSALLGGGTDATVAGLAVLPNGEVIVGGWFGTAGGVAASNIARFNPNTGVWSALLGGGTDGTVAGLAVLPNGEVIVGGLFNEAGGMETYKVARYRFGAPAPSITTQPSPQTTCLSDNVIYTVAASGTGPLTYRWRKDNAAISTIANPSAATATLTLTNVQPLDLGSYDCIVTDVCGSASCDPARLAFYTADFNGTDGVNADDIFAFLDAWFEQNGQLGTSLSADFNGNNEVTANDIFAFLDAWFAQNGVCGM